MPVILGRDGGLVIALDEVGRWLIVMEHDPRANNDALGARILLPPGGLEVIDWSTPAEGGAAEVHEMPTRAEFPAQTAWRRRA